MKMEVDDVEDAATKALSAYLQQNLRVTEHVLFAVPAQIVKVVKIICTGSTILVVRAVSCDPIQCSLKKAMYHVHVILIVQ